MKNILGISALILYGIGVSILSDNLIAGIIVMVGGSFINIVAINFTDIKLQK